MVQSFHYFTPHGTEATLGLEHASDTCGSHGRKSRGQGLVGFHRKGACDSEKSIVNMVCGCLIIGLWACVTLLKLTGFSGETGVVEGFSYLGN